VLAGDETGQTGAKLIGFVMLDLRTFACAADLPSIGAVAGRGRATELKGKDRDSRWYQLRGARQPLPEVKIFVKINCKPIVSLISGPVVAEDLAVEHRQVTANKSSGYEISRAGSQGEQLRNCDKKLVGLHGTVLLAPQRAPAGTKRDPGAWGR
jgi:hypothetical protein